MSSSLGDNRRRRLVPRWRQSRQTPTDESLPSRTAERSQPNAPAGELNELRRAWMSNRRPAFATDLMGAAVVLGRPEEAQDAAHFILEREGQVSLTALRLAAQILGVPAPPSIVELNTQETHESVQNLRRAVREAPRNPLAWLDLAWAHSASGSNDAAERAVRVALSLAPNHRAVIRSSARFLVHRHRPDEAHDLLRNSPALTRDPWLLAAEIATADVASRTSRNIKLGFRMLDSQAFSPLHISELAGALGTLELDAGSLRKARKLFEVGLKQGTENTIAQFAWAAHWAAPWEIAPTLLHVPHAFEANLWERFHAEAWDDVIEAAERWHFDEPFSARPTVIGSGVAIQTDKHPIAEKLIHTALRANPRHPALLNNLTVALASQGKIEDAFTTFRKINLVTFDEELAITITATAGLLKYRAGFPLEGRAYYDSAIERARANRMGGTAARALLFKIREELRIGAPDPEHLLRQAEEASKEAKGEMLGLTKKFLSRLVEIAAEAAESGTQHQLQKKPER